jgi:MFS family permease
VAELEQNVVTSQPALTLSSRGVQLLLVTLAAAAAAYSRSCVGPLQESMRAALGLSDNEIAFLQGPALALPLVLAAIPLGLIVDRYSRVRLLLVLALLDILGGLATAWLSDFVALFLIRCLIGLAATASAVAAYSLLADLYAPAQRGRASMIVAMGQYAGISAAFAIGGGLLGQSEPGPAGWRAAMLWLTVLLLPALLLMFGLREPARTGVVIKNPSVQDVWPELWRHRAVIIPLLLSIVTIEVALQAMLVWAAPTLSRSFALPADRTGAVVATGLMVSGLAGPLVGGFVADASQRSGGPRRTLLVLSLMTLLSVPGALFAVAPGVGIASGLLVVFLTLVSAILVAATALFTIVVPNELRGLCISASAAANVLVGTGVAPLTISVLSGVLGGPTMIGKALASVCVMAAVLGAILFSLGRRFHPRSIAQG